MENSIAFLASASALLLVPGPTNSLIATNGAISGLRRTIFLLPAELCAYMIAIVGWGLGLGAVARYVPAVIVAAKLAASAMLIVSAWKLWIFGGQDSHHRGTGPRDIFLVTISNPKALIFALTIVPHLKEGDLKSASPYLAGLAILIPIIGLGWSAIGAGLAQGLKSTVSPEAFARAGAVILLCFALGLASTAVSLFRKTDLSFSNILEFYGAGRSVRREDVFLSPEVARSRKVPMRLGSQGKDDYRSSVAIIEGWTVSWSGEMSRGGQNASSP